MGEWISARPELPQLALWACLLLGMCAMRMHTSHKPKASTNIVQRRAGWIARARAERGIAHRRNRVSVGYRSAMQTVSLSRKELNHHGLVLGSTGSGKTTALSLLIQGHEAIGPCIVLDVKGSPALRDAVLAAGGLVWTIGGRLKLDLLDPDPTVLAEQLTEASRHDGPSEVYSEAAARAVQWIGHMLRWEGITPTLDAVERLLEPEALKAALERHAGKPRVAQWQSELEAASPVERSGMATALMRITRLLDSAAGPSLGAGPEAIRLEDVVQGRTTFLLSLDSRRYPSLARVLGGWALIAMQRACVSVPEGASCLMVVDEVGALGAQAKHVRPLLALARDTHVGLVLAAHGPSQLDAALGGLASQILQETAWQVIMAQGDPDDADRLSRLFPLVDDDKQRLGRYATGTPTVTRDMLMWLGTGDCAYRVRPVDGQRGRYGCARVAQPKRLDMPAMLTEAPLTGGIEPDLAASESLLAPSTGVTPADERPEDEIKAIVYKEIIIEDGFRMWAGKLDDDGYPKVLIPRPEGWSGSKWKFYWLKVHRAIVGWEQGPIPARWEVDHECGLKRCLDHMKAKPKKDNLANKAARARGELPTGHSGPR